MFDSNIEKYLAIEVKDHKSLLKDAIEEKLIDFYVRR